MGILNSLVFSEPIIIRRYPVSTTDSAGYAVSGVPEEIEALGSVQPANGRDLLVLPEGARSADYRAILTETPVYTTNPEDGTPSDEIEVVATGDVYIADVVSHTRKVLPHYTVLCSRKPEALGG